MIEFFRARVHVRELLTIVFLIAAVAVLFNAFNPTVPMNEPPPMTTTQSNANAPFFCA